SLWVGALVPLLIVLKEAQVENRAGVARVMRHYGHVGWGFIGLMLMSGLYLILQLLHTLAELTGTSYGRLLMLKLLIVLGLMSLGAINKFRLVPALASKSSFRA